MHLEVAGARKSENPSLEGSSSGHMTDNDMRLVCNSSMESTVHVIRDYILGSQARVGFVPNQYQWDFFSQEAVF